MIFRHNEGHIYAKSADGRLLAEITFPEIKPGVVDINHTFVDASLRGQNVAGQLVSEAVQQIEQRGMRAVATCSYAAQWFAKHPAQARAVLVYPDAPEPTE